MNNATVARAGRRRVGEARLPDACRKFKRLRVGSGTVRGLIKLLVCAQAAGARSSFDGSWPLAFSKLGEK
jgi:hypothetical protein